MLRDGEWDAVRGIVDDIIGHRRRRQAKALNVDTKFLHNTPPMTPSSRPQNPQQNEAKVHGEGRLRPDVAFVEPDYINYPAAEG